jgi:putative DNA primase/helicase
MQSEALKDQARGRWRSLLPALGVDPRFLTGKHTPCPMCGGRDRFRFDDHKSDGGYICGQCGSGDGIKLVMRVNGVTFYEAKQRIQRELPTAAIVAPKMEKKDFKSGAVRTWGRGLPLHESDAVCRYLKKRGIDLGRLPSELRCQDGATYHDDDGGRSQHPAMLARFVGPDGKTFTIHQTYLDKAGNKAAVPTVRKMIPGPTPKGGAVRLFYTNGSDTLGVAEGIETALSASQLHDVPVWACLNAANLRTWEPPPTIRNIIVFGDRDGGPLFTGERAAFDLAAALGSRGLNVEVRLPDIVGSDWNDHVDRPVEHVFA